MNLSTQILFLVGNVWILCDAQGFLDSIGKSIGVDLSGLSNLNVGGQRLGNVVDQVAGNVVENFFAPKPGADIPPHVYRRIVRFCTRHQDHPKCRGHPEWVAPAGADLGLGPSHPSRGFGNEMFPDWTPFRLPPVPQMALQNFLSGVPSFLQQVLPQATLGNIDEMARQHVRGSCRATGSCRKQRREALNKRAIIAEQEATFRRIINPNRQQQDIDNDVELRMSRTFQLKQALLKQAGLDSEVDPENDGTFQHDILLTEQQANTMINEINQIGSRPAPAGLGAESSGGSDGDQGRLNGNGPNNSGFNNVGPGRGFNGGGPGGGWNGGGPEGGDGFNGGNPRGGFGGDPRGGFDGDPRNFENGPPPGEFGWGPRRNHHHHHDRWPRSSLFLEATPTQRWPAGQPIPYMFDQSLSASDQQAVRSAIQEIQSKTCVKFQEVSTKPAGSHIYYVKVASPTFCGLSYIGRVEPANIIYLSFSCGDYMGTAVHETLHALGLQHEQLRGDRDQFITINWENVNPQMYDFFAVADSKQFTSYGVTYDYGSIMHYNAMIATQYAGKPTMVPKINAATNQPLMGQRKGMSAKDVEIVTKMYCMPGCEDKNVYCGAWATKDFCKKQEQFSWMVQNCQKSCGFCGGG